MSWTLEDDIDSAESHTRYGIGNLRQAAECLDKAMQKSPEIADSLRGLGLQLWTMEEMLREINTTVAKIYSEVRPRG